MNQKLYRGFAIAIGVITIFSSTTTAFAAEGATSKKEEVIYASLDGNGEQKGTYVVNILNTENGSIQDYGDYSKIRNMSSTDVLNLSEGSITGTTSSEKIYYEGTLDDAQLPWTISIKYYLDGEEMNAQDIAGCSGALKIAVSIKENNKADTSFFDNYALQAVIKLDTDICKNIVCQDAKMANVGTVKQLTYTIMAGQEKDIEITADIKDFDMAAISFNGIRSSVSIDTDQIETSGLDSSMEELQNATSSINNGVVQVKDGTKQLNEGATSLLAGVKTIQEAIDTLNGSSGTLCDGSEEVTKALAQIQSALDEVTISAKKTSQLSTASTDIKSGIDGLVSGLSTLNGSIDTYSSALSENGVDITSVISQNEEIISSLSQSVQKMQANYQTMVDGGLGESDNANALKTQIQTYTGIITMLTADNQVISGSNQVIVGIDSALDSQNGQLMTGAVSLQSNYVTFDNAVQELVTSLDSLTTNMSALKSGIDTLVTEYSGLDSGIRDYTKAVSQIAEGYVSIYDGTNSMLNGTSSLYGATQELASGTQEFVDKTSNMDTEIQDKIDDILGNISGGDFVVKSFVSDKNTNIESVQFVIQTEVIEKTEVVAVTEDTSETLSVWQKLLKLYGM